MILLRRTGQGRTGETTRSRVRRGATEQLKAEALRLLAWARSSDSWRQARKRKQQPVGLSEEQASFTFAVIRAQVLAKTGGQYRPRWPR